MEKQISRSKVAAAKDDISWFVYVLRCRDSSFYVGITKDLRKRLKVHNLGRGPHYTKVRRPLRLVYYEEHPSKSSARKREIEIKGWRRAKKEALVAGSLRATPSG